MKTLRIGLCLAAVLTALTLVGCANVPRLTLSTDSGGGGGQQVNSAGEQPLYISSLSDSVVPGGRIKLQVYALPDTPVSIETDGVSDNASSPMSQRTDGSGVATWQWELSPSYSADTVPVVVTADYQDGQKKIVRELPVERVGAAGFPAALGDTSRVVRPGEEVTVVVKTAPHASVDVQAHGLSVTNPNILADDAGNASWTFKVGSDYHADKIPVLVTVKKNNRERKIVGEFGVLKFALEHRGTDL